MIEVVIPVHNRRAITLRCLELLAAQADAEFRVTVVDDGSSDGTSQAITERFAHVDVLQGDGSLWWAGATNLGIRHALQRDAVAPYILMLNDDVEFDSGYLAQMKDCAVANPGCLIGTLAVYSDDPDRVLWCGKAVPYRRCWYGYVPRDSVSGCVPAEALPGRGMLVPTEVFKYIGLLDEKPFPQYAADLDFSLRARKAGYRLLCCCDTALTAMASKTGAGSIHRRDPITVFLRSFWNVRSANYLPAVWRLWTRHHDILGHFWLPRHLARVLVGDFLRRTGLRPAVRLTKPQAIQ